jgi:hypothetical protein
VGEMVVCDRCEGVGEVEDDYTPDYDNYDEWQTWDGAEQWQK